MLRVVCCVHVGKEAREKDVMAEVYVCCVLCVVCECKQGGWRRRCHGRGSCVLRVLFGMLCVHVGKEAGDEDVMAEINVCCVLLCVHVRGVSVGGGGVK